MTILNTTRGLDQLIDVSLQEKMYYGVMVALMCPSGILDCKIIKKRANYQVAYKKNDN